MHMGERCEPGPRIERADCTPASPDGYSQNFGALERTLYITACGVVLGFLGYMGLVIIFTIVLPTLVVGLFVYCLYLTKGIEREHR